VTITERRGAAVSPAELAGHEDRVLRAVDRLRYQNAASIRQRNRIRNILNGGRSAVRELLGPETTEADLPVAHYIDSGLNRLGTKLGHRPDVRVDARADRDNQTDRDRAAKRTRIVEGYDQNSRLEMMLPQAGRWLPGYGYCVWVIKEKKNLNGDPFPHAALRNPYNCYLGPWGEDQQPDELAISRIVPTEVLRDRYPAYDQVAGRRPAGGWAGMSPVSGPGWESTPDGTIVVEYYDEVGTWVITQDTGTLLEFAPNALRSGPRFVAAKRFSFDFLMGHYDNVFGLMRMIAIINMLALVSTQDGTLRETNIIGEILSGKYQKGRNKVNIFATGTRIERPGADIAFGAFQEASRLEEQLRIGANYPETEDAKSPTPWATGRGLAGLGGGKNDEVSEYYTVLRHALQDLDAKRLEHDEVYYPRRRKPLVVNVKGDRTIESYVPAQDIAGEYGTRRVYGMMAGWDDSEKVVGGLQLQGAQVLDRRTFRENLYGIDNHEQVEERIDQDRASDALFAILEARAANQDAAASHALVEIATNPKQRVETLRKLFPAAEPQLSPEEEQFLQAQAGGGGGLDVEQPRESVGTILSRLESEGAAEGGAQTVSMT